MKATLSCVAASLILISSLAGAAEPAKAIAKVNGVSIPASLADLMVAEQVAQGAPNNDELRRAVKDELVRRELLAQEARKKGLDKKPEMLVRMDVARQGILIGGYINDWMRANPVAEAKVRAEYDARVKNMASTEYRVRHIQVDTEDAAKALISKLQAGSRFEDLAKESNDTGSKDNGGDIGWVSPKGVPEAIGAALPTIEKGKFSAVPVKSNFGFHVLKVEDTRQAVPPKYEEVAENLRRELEQQALSNYVNSLVSKAKVE
ncbi:peptidyl-prolyl cis-trans isomerase [Uliginosibacterium paludis]|jgi:peptidyl-prolyl cis-trans isomerase C|uniref:peptidylprolyl isomerase n=1 Tax=Uliginosibacterium paludis TaxID=1615952 RepID=A0ABV2CTZ8_9RHOO